MTLTSFINKYLGKKVDFDGTNGCQCFTKDHFILMADWTYKAIQDVQVGDKVIGYDNEVNTVIKTFNSMKKVVHIRTRFTDLYVTPDHPFYFKDGTFKPAIELETEAPAMYDKEFFKPSGLTDNELLFLGFWLGDGNIAKHHDNRVDEIRVTFGEKKADFVHSLDMLSAERLHHETNNAYVGAISKRAHPLLTKIILEQCAGDYKKLPLSFNNRELALILDGFIHADGSLHNNSYTILNTSPYLLYAMQAICIKLGYSTSSIRPHRRPDGDIYIRGKLVKSVKPLYRLTVCKKTTSWKYPKVEIEDIGEQEVFNLETDNTHTYICNNYKVHNCTDLARQYFHDVWGVEQFPALGADGGAKDIFDKCTNVNVTVDSALADYSRGDVLIWNSSKTNKYGHVAILVDVYNTKYFIVLEQDGFKQDGVKLAFRSRENLRGCLWK